MGTDQSDCHSLSQGGRCQTKGRWTSRKCLMFHYRCQPSIIIKPATSNIFGSREKLDFQTQNLAPQKISFLFLRGMRGEGEGGAGCYLNVQLHLHSKWDITGKSGGSQHSTSRDLEISSVSTGNISCFYWGQTFERGLKLMLCKVLINSLIV